ncbi:MAG: hypothetical protein PF505_09610 [Vallitaleaceae bacterium]|jgi:hypothetical protein|nr:hypothetical protein [Vallitaleaceae bacterium]
MEYIVKPWKRHMLTVVAAALFFAASILAVIDYQLPFANDFVFDNKSLVFVTYIYIFLHHISHVIYELYVNSRIDFIEDAELVYDTNRNLQILSVIGMIGIHLSFWVLFAGDNFWISGLLIAVGGILLYPYASRRVYVTDSSFIFDGIIYEFVLIEKFKSIDMYRIELVIDNKKHNISCRGGKRYDQISRILKDKSEYLGVAMSDFT